ncbi:hypothetical protein CYMTET_16408 [Cymbomonas tetramitiformis]|uniref:Uncharacterized protein n=1 Tax=Cymbomonas tetramitiformis TaxID=36881 RepID=A0AAE0L8C3_9CHLO|nr:hypothetical protein CYMTET_16408 [Cymbomonas tetramitiformis]
MHVKHLSAICDDGQVFGLREENSRPIKQEKLIYYSQSAIEFLRRVDATKEFGSNLVDDPKKEFLEEFDSMSLNKEPLRGSAAPLLPEAVVVSTLETPAEEDDWLDWICEPASDKISAPKVLTGSCTAMREFPTLASGYAACQAESCAFPFVVRQSADFIACASEATIRAALTLEPEVKGFDARDGTFGYLPGRDALGLFDAGAGKLNIIDAEASLNTTACNAADMLPAAMCNLPGAEVVNPRLRLAYVLSPLATVPGSLGHLHVDPLMGSGWQYIASGLKTWRLRVLPLWLAALCRDG